MNDADSLKTAYGLQLQKLYAGLCQNYAEAAGDAEGEKTADAAFTTGLSIARRTLDRALTLAAR